MADFPDWSNGSQASYTRLLWGLISSQPVNGLDVSNYASVVVMLFNNNGTAVLSADYTFVDSGSGLIVDQGLLTADATTFGYTWPTFTLPVSGGLFKLYANDSTLQAVVLGSSTVSPKRLNGDAVPARIMGATVPANTVAGTSIQMTDLTVAGPHDISLPNLTSYNGEIQVSTFLSQNISYGINTGWRAYNGGRVLSPVLTAAGIVTPFVIGHPYAFCSWWVSIGATTPASATTVDVYIGPATPMR